MPIVFCSSIVHLLFFDNFEIESFASIAANPSKCQIKIIKNKLSLRSKTFVVKIVLKVLRTINCLKYYTCYFENEKQGHTTHRCPPVWVRVYPWPLDANSAPRVFINIGKVCYKTLLCLCSLSIITLFFYEIGRHVEVSGLIQSLFLSWNPSSSGVLVQRTLIQPFSKCVPRSSRAGHKVADENEVYLNDYFRAMLNNYLSKSLRTARVEHNTEEIWNEWKAYPGGDI